MKTTFSRFLAVTMALVLVLTCMISGFAVSVAAEGTATTVDANLFTNKNITKTLTPENDLETKEDGSVKAIDRGANFGLETTLPLGNRYVVRFEAKGISAQITPYPGAWGLGKSTTATDDWRAYQIMFTTQGDWDETKEALWISISLADTTVTEGSFEMRNVQLLAAPSDGSFNLVPGGDMELGEATQFFRDQLYDGGVEVAKDPLGGDNNVLYFKVTSGNSPVTGKGYTSYNNFTSIANLDSSKILKIKFRMLGYMRFTNYGSAEYLNNPSQTTVTGGGTQHVYYYAPTGWRTVEYYIHMTDGVDNLQFVNTQYSTTKELWIDDLEIYEVGTEVESISIEETVPVDAYAGDKDINVYALKTVPENVFLFGKNGETNPITWSIADNTCVDSSSATVTPVTLTEGGVMNLTTMSNKWSLANVNPTVTLSVDGEAVGSAPIEWKYPKYIGSQGTFEFTNNATTAYWRTSGGAGFTARFDATGGYNATGGITAPDATSLSIYGTVFGYIKPNSTYRVTYKYKSADAAASTYMKWDGTNMTKVSTPTVNGGSEGGWRKYTALYTSPAAPYSSYTYGLHPVFSGHTTGFVFDDFAVELIDEDSEILGVGDFEGASTTTDKFDSLYSGTVYDYIPAGQIEGGIGGNTSGMVKVLPGISGGNSTSQFYFSVDFLQPFHAYEISFKHYGDAGRFTNITWSQSIIAAGAGNANMSVTEEWKEYKVYFVAGQSIVNNGNWSYLFYFDSTAATEGFYIDDFVIKEVQSVYTMRGHNRIDNTNQNTNVANPVFTDYDQKQALYGTITMKAGSQSLTNSTVRPVTAGTTVTVTLTPTAGYLPIPGTLELVTLSGERTPILNSALTAMTESKGNEFTFVTPDETAYVTCEFAKIETQGYQWGTIGSALRRTAGVIDGMRFLNRLYIDGLDWSASELKTTIDGVEYTIKEIGAKARVYDANATTTLLEDATALKGTCYVEGNPNVRVTDYTQQYFDFTVVIPIAEGADTSVEYECGSYMILVPTAGGEEITVETTAMIDSVDAAVVRGA